MNCKDTKTLCSEENAAENVFFSLILPVYNVAAYVERCVASILGQAFSDCEIILVDDGSTDDSPAICDRLATENKCVRVIHKENGGLSSARNAGLDEARGQYIWFIDSDDWIEDGALEQLQAVCCDLPDVVKFGHYRVEGEKALVPQLAKEGLYRDDALAGLRRLAFCAAGKYGLSACMHVYRRQLLEEHNLRFVTEREVGSEDYLFNLQVIVHAASVRVLSCALYNYELRGGSLSQTYKPDLIEKYTRLLERLKAYYRQENIWEQYKKQAYYFYLWHLAVGTCFSYEYLHITDGHSVQDGRKNVRAILNRKAVQEAVVCSDKTGCTIKKKIQLAAMRCRVEPLFYWLYVMKPQKKEKRKRQ